MINNQNNKLSRGFTIVELLIVIVVIGILAALVLNSFAGAQDRARVTSEINDIKVLQKAVLSYYAVNSAYPSTGASNAWVGWNQTANFIPGISPTYIVTQPQQKTNPAGDITYLYTSDGVDYKILSHYPSSNQKYCNIVKQYNNSFADINTRNCWAFGVWSSGAISW